MMTKEEIKTTEESTNNISGYDKNKRRIPVDQFQVPYYSNFVPHDYVTNESFKLQVIMCNLLKRQSAPDVDICEGADKFDECEKIIKKAAEERSNLIDKKKLCYGCLEPITKEDNETNCKQKPTCKTCGNSHPTALHRCAKKVRSDTST